jgi:hypothetical protein
MDTYNLLRIKIRTLSLEQLKFEQIQLSKEVSKMKSLGCFKEVSKHLLEQFRIYYSFERTDNNLWLCILWKRGDTGNLEIVEKGHSAKKYDSFRICLEKIKLLPNYQNCNICFDPSVMDFSKIALLGDYFREIEKRKELHPVSALEEYSIKKKLNIKWEFERKEKGTICNCEIVDKSGNIIIGVKSFVSRESEIKFPKKESKKRAAAIAFRSLLI